ncbi:MAG: alpha/beta fold hydrolase [Caulobacteraceae bacterium]|nr:alpha/beta fold hydrolase [Caulobacteraceae bacterium]
MLKLALRALAVVILLVLAYIAIGGGLGAAAGHGKMRGEKVDIGGRSLRIVCLGEASGAPLVVFESGAFGFSADWGVVQDRLAAKGLRSCSYDRAGLGFSDPGPKPRDAAAIARDLDALLRARGEAGPYVLVGHSMAGLFVRQFAVTHPDRVAGVVLVDAATPEAIYSPMATVFVKRFAQASTLAGWGASAGLFKPLAPLIGDRIGLTGEAKAEKQRFFGSGPHNRWAAEEVRTWPHSAEQVLKAGGYDPAWPVAVVTAGPEAGREDWKRVQAAPATASRAGSVAHVAAAGHATLLGVRHAAAIVAAIEGVLAARSAPARPTPSPPEPAPAPAA